MRTGVLLAPFFLVPCRMMPIRFSLIRRQCRGSRVGGTATKGAENRGASSAHSTLDTRPSSFAGARPLHFTARVLDCVLELLLTLEVVVVKAGRPAGGAGALAGQRLLSGLERRLRLLQRLVGGARPAVPALALEPRSFQLIQGRSLARCGRHHPDFL